MKNKEEYVCVVISEVTKEATCMEKGIRTYTCGCGETWTEEIAKNESSPKKISIIFLLLEYFLVKLFIFYYTFDELL